MLYHHHCTAAVAYQRTEKRKDYARLYLAVQEDHSRALLSDNNKALAWTDWQQAKIAAGRNGMIVVNWEYFQTHILTGLFVRPAALRVCVTTKRGSKYYHAELDAPADQLRTLNQYCEWELKRRPDAIKAEVGELKVRPEDET